MRQFAILVFLIGCGAATPRYGNYLTTKHPKALHRALAASAAAAALELHPDASQRWRLGQPTTDLFGQAFADALRKRGHRVSVQTSPEVAGEHVVQYVVDQIKGTTLLRVELTVGAVVLCQAYHARSDGSIAAAGAWSRAAR